MVAIKGPPRRGTAINREEGGTKGTCGTMGIRGTNGVTIREPTVAAGGSLGAGDKVHGGKHGEIRTVNTARGIAWGKCT